MNTNAIVPIFTPNVVRGDPGLRWKLYRFGPTTFAATPDGPWFNGSVEPDTCGEACNCAAYLTPFTPDDRLELETAETL